MSKTDTRINFSLGAFIAVLSMALGPQSANAQTLAEVANKQRAKLMAESNPSQTVPEGKGAEVTPLPTPKAPPPTPWRVYSVFAVGQKVSAEVVHGDQLITLSKGSTVGHYRVIDISLTGVKLETSKGCGRKCPAIKVVALGGAF